MKKNSLFWFRRDLRLEDNTALYNALNNSDSVACVFVFDKSILEELSKNDLRVDFLWNCLNNLKKELRFLGSDLIIAHDYPENIIPIIADKYKVTSVYCNEDYEPNARKRDETIAQLLESKNIGFLSYKDHVIFAKDEILNNQGQTYTVFTQYSNAWKKKFKNSLIKDMNNEELFNKLAKFNAKDLISIEELGFSHTHVSKMKIGFSNKEASSLLNTFIEKRIKNYKITRDFPSISGCSYLSVHNRFGTISIRKVLREALSFREQNINAKESVDAWVGELIWRDFYFQLIYNHPRVIYEPFQGDFIDFPWENDMENFQKWCDGETGYPLVDAAMKQLNNTGYMHNRLRMVVASFLTKHLLVDYRLGEQYFAAKLLDFDLSANNGGWQWAASTGCDSQPYFRIFNPILQSEKFDPEGKFIKKMLPVFSLIDKKYIHNPSEFKDELKMLGINLGIEYPIPIVNHKQARQRTLSIFKEYINNKV
ncbi:deoxyribodipyrimidine photo-lyase [archaeon]|nr:deoxyribodipyrimidine photo-lyase [archaeon]NCQ51980.1 deoxyribodipyrimidine photo-lyase [archaeon]